MADPKEERTEPPHSCFYDGKEFSHGAKNCQVGEVMRCDDGRWFPTGQNCPPEPAEKPPRKPRKKRSQ